MQDATFGETADKHDIIHMYQSPWDQEVHCNHVPWSKTYIGSFTYPEACSYNMPIPLCLDTLRFKDCKAMRRWFINDDS